MLSNVQTLNNIVANKASALAVQTFNKAILNPEQAGRFLREATEDQPVMREASVVTMKSHTKNLDRVTLDGRILHSGYDATGKTRELTDDEKVSIKTWQNQLVAQKLKTQAEIEDDELEDNLEGKAFVNTLLDLIGEQVSSDMEVWALFADKDTISFATDDLLSTTQGWIPKAGNKVYKDDIEAYATDNDLDGDSVEAIFDSMIDATPKKFIKNRNMMRFYVPYQYEKAYRDGLKERGTALGDATIQGYQQLVYEGIPVVHVPSMDDTTVQTLYRTPTLLLTTPANMVAGIWRQISIEPERHAAKEMTEYVLTMRGDVHYINEFMATAAFPEIEAPE